MSWSPAASSRGTVCVASEVDVDLDRYGPGRARAQRRVGGHPCARGAAWFEYGVSLPTLTLAGST